MKTSILAAAVLAAAALSPRVTLAQSNAAQTIAAPAESGETLSLGQISVSAAVNVTFALE